MDFAVLLKALICIFFAILFLQSGWDKVADRKGNLEWLTSHFASSPFKNLVAPLLSLLTLLELAAGLGCLMAAPTFYIGGPSWIAPAALSLCLVTFLCLFLGQRLAKDYVGAASLASYFGIGVLSLWLILTI